MLKTIILGLLLGLVSIHADFIKPLVQIGVDMGGSTLATVEHYDEYDGYYEKKVHAGQGLSFEVGTSIGEPKDSVEVQLTAGYRFDSDSADNGKVTWDIIPVSLIAMFKKNRWKFGGGVTYHVNPHLSGSFKGYDNGEYFNDSVNDHYQNTFGTILKIQYRTSRSMDLGIKGTFIKYKLKGDPKVTSNGNNIGLFFTYTFGNETYQYR